MVVRSLFWLSVLLAVLSSAQPASAQSVEVSPATFKFVREVPRTAAQFQFTINYADCRDSFKENLPTYIQINPVLKGFDRRKSSLEVWVAASQDCTKDDQRKITGNCRMVAQVSPQTTGQQIIVNPADVVEAVRNPNGTTTDLRGEGNLDSCEANISASVKFYIMLIEGGQVQGKSATWDKSEIDISPPSPGTGLEVNPGDKALFPTWDASDATDLQGFLVFCERISCSSMAAPPTDGTAGAAGASGAFGSACLDQSGVLQPGLRLTPEQSQRYRCADAPGRFAASADVYSVEGQPIVNNDCYAVGLSAVDLVLNESVLSDVMCATPREVTTFFEGYKGAGGKGGGGFCGVAPGQVPSRILLASAAFGAFLLLLRRTRLLGGRK